MTYGEERLHFPDNLKPEKKSSKGWILIFMAVCIVCGILIIVYVSYAQRIQYNIQCLLPTSNKYIQMGGKVVKGEDIISTVQNAIDENKLICIEVVTLGGTVTFCILIGQEQKSQVLHWMQSLKEIVRHM